MSVLILDAQVQAHLSPPENRETCSGWGGLKARVILQNTQRVLAIELVCASQGLDLRGPDKCGRGTGAAYLKIRKKVPMVKKDRPLSAFIESVSKMISNGSLLESVESSVQ
jgi:histidine ammonia-lyase